MFEPTPLEKTILDDVHSRTGLSFRRVGGIDTRDKTIADTVLPILAGWIEKVDHANHRHSLYSRFNTPYAYQYLEKIISWWVNEQHEAALSSLAQSLALLVKCTDAERVWKLCQELPHRPCYYLLVSRLAGCPQVEREAKDALVRGLKTEALRAGDLEDIAKVSDPRIRQWFEGKVNSPDRYIRAVAKRAVSRGKALPEGLEYSPLAPERSAELFSTEEDLGNAKQLLQKVAKDFRLKISSAIKASAFLSSLELNRWVVADVSTANGASASLWFRLEDVDTVEVVLLSTARPTQTNAIS